MTNQIGLLECGPMQDFLDQDLALGDTVVFTRPNYRDMTYGVVLKFTKHYVQVLYKRHWGDHTDTYLADPKLLIKADNGKCPKSLREKYEELCNAD